MSALTVSQDPEQSWDDLVRFWEEMEWPEGSKVEIIEGIITVSPAPAYRHHVIAARIQRRLYSVIPEDWEIFQTLAIAVPSRLGMLIPDLVVPGTGPHRVGLPHPRRPRRAGRRGHLEVQRTSRPRRQARRLRHRRHPAVPPRRPLGPDGPTATLYGEPKGDVHRPLATAKFGEPLKLPAPFGLVIDTSEFPAT